MYVLLNSKLSKSYPPVVSCVLWSIHWMLQTCPPQVWTHTWTLCNPTSKATYPKTAFLLCIYVCVWLCVWERERKRANKKERESEGSRESFPTDINISLVASSTNVDWYFYYEAAWSHSELYLRLPNWAVNSESIRHPRLQGLTSEC